VKRSVWLFAITLMAALLAYVVLRREAGPGGDGPVPGPPRLPHEFKGIVFAAGVPAEGAHVVLYEEVAGGYTAETRAASDGTFVLSWTPTLVVDPERLFVVAWDEEGYWARTIAPVDPVRTVVELRPPADVRGRILTPEGEPLAGVRVAVAPRHAPQEAFVAESDREGRFVAAPSIPRGWPLDVLAHGAGRAAQVEGRFRGGDTLVLHLARGREVRLRLVDPRGRPVPRARVRLAVPDLLASAAPAAVADADGRVAVPDASAGGLVAVVVEADGFLPVEAHGWPGTETTVILWPARELQIVAWDAWNSRAVEGVEVTVDAKPAPGAEWWGPNPAGVTRVFPSRPARAAGTYVALVPSCDVTLHLSAPGYGDGSADVARTAARATVRMQPPLSREKPALLQLRGAADTPELELVVADEQGGFFRIARLREGRADVLVPPGERLQVASVGAADGRFLPKHTADALSPGERRTMRLATRRAHRLDIVTDPAVKGEVTLVDAELERHLPARTVPLADGHAAFWVRPYRKLRVTVQPPAGFFTHEAELETQNEDVELEIHLVPATQLAYRIEDACGNPVPFARVLLYEPGAGGRMALEARPRAALADPEGWVRFEALRSGTAAVDMAAHLFRGRRFSLVELPRAEVVDGGVITLAPAPHLGGVVVDTEGVAARGVQVRVLAPRVTWLPLPGGGERELYDLTESGLGDGVTDEEGAFDVRDEAPESPLVAFYPGTASRLAPMAFEPADRFVLQPVAYVELELPGSAEGVYLLIGRSKALLVKTDPPMSLRPLPLLRPAGRQSLFIRMRDRRWAAPIVDLKPGETIRLAPEWQR